MTISTDYRAGGQPPAPDEPDSEPTSKGDFDDARTVTKTVEVTVGRRKRGRKPKSDAEKFRKTALTVPPDVDLAVEANRNPDSPRAHYYVESARLRLWLTEAFGQAQVDEVLSDIEAHQDYPDKIFPDKNRISKQLR